MTGLPLVFKKLYRGETYEINVVAFKTEDGKAPELEGLVTFNTDSPITHAYVSQRYLILVRGDQVEYAVRPLAIFYSYQKFRFELNHSVNHQFVNDHAEKGEFMGFLGI
jgi:hypothetical protein